MTNCYYFYNVGLNIVSEFNLENVTEYLNDNHFDQIEDNMQDSIAEDEVKSDIVIEKYLLNTLLHIYICILLNIIYI